VFKTLKRLLAGAALASTALVGPVKADPSPAILIGAGAAVAVIAAEALHAEQPDKNRAFVTLGSGYFDVYRREAGAGYFSFEYWPAWHLWHVRPMLGAFATTDAAVAAYVGIGYDFHIGEHFVIDLNVAPTFYSAGNGKDLGSFALLRSGVEVGYRFSNGTRLMASYHHMSHGGLLNPGRNPGTNTAALSVHFPVKLLETMLAH
jgi:lipid A 3-O-deacylase